LVGQISGVWAVPTVGVEVASTGATAVGAVGVDVISGFAVVGVPVAESPATPVASGPGLDATGVDVGTPGIDWAGVAVANGKVGSVAIGVDVATGITVVGVAVGVIVGVAVGVIVGVAVGSDAVKHPAADTTFVSSVTAPLRARARPGSTVAPVFSVTLVSARMLPTNAVSVPSVAELPTCQNTLHVGPLINTTDELLAVVSVLAIWKMNSAAGLPSVLRVRTPVNCADDVKQ
jgi:hypothetical protein